MIGIVLFIILVIVITTLVIRMIPCKRYRVADYSVDVDETEDTSNDY